MYFPTMTVIIEVVQQRGNSVNRFGKFSIGSDTGFKLFPQRYILGAKVIRKQIKDAFDAMPFLSFCSKVSLA